MVIKLPLLLFSIVTKISCSPWVYTCEENTDSDQFCLRQLETEVGEASTPLTETACSLVCPQGASLWPLPSSVTLGTQLVNIHPEKLLLGLPANNDVTKDRLNRAIDRQVELLLGKSGDVEVGQEDTVFLQITLELVDESDTFNLDTDESYSLNLTTGLAPDSENTTRVYALVQAQTFLGARHGLETLYQLMDWDAEDEKFLIVNSAQITDSPVYKHRGLSLDTVRNFISVGKIESVLDSLSYSKMNVLHWHLSDTQSFPLQLQFNPDFSRYGAYSAREVYTREQVLGLVEYAKDRGITIIPELDAPAHVGAGWQAVNESFTVCVNKEPWEDYCVQAPCGQLNPASEGMYQVLKNIHKELFELFGTNYLHMGGDEVHFGCWNTSSEIQAWLESEDKTSDEAGFLHLWHHFQDTAYNNVLSLNNGTAPLATYLWTSHLTHQENLKDLDASKYTIQIWDDESTKGLAESGFKLVFSPTEVYLDCGFGSWVGEGNNWCSPYKGWNTVYEVDPEGILEDLGVSNLSEAKANIMGGEVAMWAEQTDDSNILTKLEPRASAYAERLWLGRAVPGWRAAEGRMARHRMRLVSRGIEAEQITQRWCIQNPGKCLLPQPQEGEDPDPNFSYHYKQSILLLIFLTCLHKLL